MRRLFVISDRAGRRMVMGRATAAEAIDQIAMAIAGRRASAEAKRAAWEKLRDEHGYRVEQVIERPIAARGVNRP
jgi:ABC-type hemin transport system substrate-binding protein